MRASSTGRLVANGDYWRLVSAMFLHYGPIHLGLNMLALWWFGAAVEQVLGRGRYLLLYIVAGLAGSAGALFAPESLTVGASARSSAFSALLSCSSVSTCTSSAAEPCRSSS